MTAPPSSRPHASLWLWKIGGDNAAMLKADCAGADARMCPAWASLAECRGGSAAARQDRNRAQHPAFARYQVGGSLARWCAPAVGQPGQNCQTVGCRDRTTAAHLRGTLRGRDVGGVLAQRGAPALGQP